nr:uncharacterized protein LOC129385849 [Dermacentor andersoni]
MTNPVTRILMSATSEVEVEVEMEAEVVAVLLRCPYRLWPLLPRQPPRRSLALSLSPLVVLGFHQLVHLFRHLFLGIRRRPEVHLLELHLLQQPQLRLSYKATRGIQSDVTLRNANRAARRELICTVGGIATEYRQYPADGLCHYIYYTDVFIHSNVSEIWSTRFITSFKVFQERMPKYQKTQGGLSFDVRASNSSIVDSALGSLKLLQEKNIVHYGSLNVIDKIATLGGLVVRAIALVKSEKALG